MSSIMMVRIGDYCKVVKGKIGIKKAVEGNYPLVTTAEERLSHNEYHFDKPSVIIPVVSSTGHGHASLKRIHYQDGKFSVGSILAVVTPEDQSVVNANFLYHYLDIYKEQLLVSQMKGMANVTLSVKAIENVEFPLMSPEQQLEWVSLFTKTKKYTGSLSSEISLQQIVLKKLRQQILQDAISGKLTAKWREENHDIEPASKLLVRIKAEKERLVKEKMIRKAQKIKNQKSLPDDFEIPPSWQKVKIDDVLFVTKLAGFEYTKYFNLSETGDIPVIRAQNVRPIDIDKTNLLYIDSETSYQLERCALTKEALLVTFIGAGIGDVAFFNENERWHLAPNVAKIECHPFAFDYINLLYLNYFLLSPRGQKELFKHIKATAQPSLSMGTIRDIEFYLPPYEEACKAVERIKKALILVDQLEVQSTKSQQEAALLMQTVLKEAFEE